LFRHDFETFMVWWTPSSCVKRFLLVAPLLENGRMTVVDADNDVEAAVAAAAAAEVRQRVAASDDEVLAASLDNIFV
jgi:hypothetical protein